MRSYILLTLLFVFANTAISEPKHFKSFDGDYTLEFGYSAEINSFKVDPYPAHKLDISIENNAFVINNVPYEYNCKIFQNHSTGGFFMDTVARCKLDYDLDVMKEWVDKNDSIFCHERGFWDNQNCVRDMSTKGFQQTFKLNVVKEHLFLQMITSDGPDNEWYSGNLIILQGEREGETIKDITGLHNQILLKKRSNFFENFIANPTKDRCNYLNSGCSYPDEWAGWIEELHLTVIEKFNYVKRNLSISIPASNYFVYGEDLYENDGSEGEMIGRILGGAVTEGACQFFLSLPGCGVVGSELGSYYGRELTVQDGSTIEQNVCVGYVYVYGNEQVFDIDNYIYLCEEFSHPAEKDYSKYIPTYFTEPSIGFYMKEFEGID